YPKEPSMPARIVSCISLAAVAIVLTACRSDRPAADPGPGEGAPGGSAGTASAPAANVLTVTASDFTYDAPVEVPAGLTEIRLVNKGPSLHHIQLMKLEDGKTLEDFLGALKGEQFPTWATDAGGPAPPERDDTTTVIQSLEPGTYALICFIPAPDGMPHVMKGMSRELKVMASSAAAAAEPEADVTVTLVDYDFQLSQPLTSGKHTIRVENAAAQPHEIAIVRLNPGKKPADYTAWGMKQVGPPPGTIHGGVSGIMPGDRVFIKVDLPPGEYGLLCFLPDKKDGKPHFVHGMAKQTAVAS
ncbi:MAG: hypothetical protein ACREM9_09200, partial [Gemmatimonadales bacterium]